MLSARNGRDHALVPVASLAGETERVALERHLAVTALLEALYLSARTGQPETPRKFYEVQKWPEPAP